jgi:hypothetical protein
MSDEQLEKLYESMSDDDLGSLWNHSGITDDMGELEEELMLRGFEDLWRPNGRRNRRLDEGDKDGWQRSSRRTHHRDEAALPAHT